MDWKKWAKTLFGGAQRAGVTKFNGPPTSVPPTPGRAYICANCGMLIKWGHTREECGNYSGDPTNPDLRAHKTILPGRNDPEIMLPYYQSSKESAKID